MSTDHLIEQIKVLPREAKWTVFQFLSREFVRPSDSSLFDEFSLIGSDIEGADISFAQAAQAEMVRNG